MNKEQFFNLLDKFSPLLSDGAMGTLLNQRGISSHECFDELNLTNPALVAEIHHEYIDAGSQIIQTNTFGANRFKLSRHGIESKVKEINVAGIELAKRVILASYKEVLIAGDIGPLGIRLAPYGRIKPEEAYDAFAEQILALVSAQPDLLIIETMTDLHEINEAIRAAKNIASSIPLIASMTFTRDDRTLLGDTPEKVAQKLFAAGADIVGANCSGGPHQLLRIIQKMRRAVPEGHFSAMPNAGWPEQIGGRIMYTTAPDYFGEYAAAFASTGLSIFGGCCGTTPQHITSFKKALQSLPSSPIIEITAQDISKSPETINQERQQITNLAQKLNNKQFVVAVEMDPPRSLSVHKLLAGASLLADAGADVINVADSPMARMRMSPWAVCSLIQRKINIETVLHFPTRGRNLLRVQGDLLAAHVLDIRNVFVVMGDPTSIGDYPYAMDKYDLVPSGLIKLIKQGFNAGVDHAGSNIGQPASFFVGCALNLNPSDIIKETQLLRRKIEAGADFILTQPVFDIQKAHEFIETYHREFGELSTPILAGVMPLASVRHASFLQYEVPGITIPDDIFDKIQSAGESAPQLGTEIAIDLVQQAKSFAQGAYIMPVFNRFDQVAEIIEATKNS